MKEYIYYLIDPRNNEVKYIGKTKTPKRRYRQHLKKLDRNATPKNLWLLELFKLKLAPKMIIAQEISGDGREAEQRHLDLHKTTALNIHNPRKGEKSRKTEEIKWS